MSRRLRMTRDGVIPADLPDRLKPSRAWRYSARWQRYRRAVLERDGRRCAECGACESRMVVDHIQRVADGGAIWDLGNLQTLCFTCAGRKTGRGE